MGARQSQASVVPPRESSGTSSPSNWARAASPSKGSMRRKVSRFASCWAGDDEPFEAGQAGPHDLGGAEPLTSDIEEQSRAIVLQRQLDEPNL
jgi:hypothetical protein